MTAFHLRPASFALTLILAAWAVPAAAEDPTIRIDNFTFTPSTLTVPAGTVVRWVNQDDIPHLVAEKEKHFKSKVLDTDDSFTQKFDTPGRVEYFCAIHPHMTGVIIVEAPK